MTLILFSDHLSVANDQEGVCPSRALWSFVTFIISQLLRVWNLNVAWRSPLPRVLLGCSQELAGYAPIQSPGFSSTLMWLSAEFSSLCLWDGELLDATWSSWQMPLSISSSHQSSLLLQSRIPLCGKVLTTETIYLIGIVGIYIHSGCHFFFKVLRKSESFKEYAHLI